MNVLVVYLNKTSFVKQDIDILSKKFNVVEFQFKFYKIFSLINKIRKSDLIYIWFASYHTFVTTLLTKKPKVVVAGGYDLAKVPEINYGLMMNPILRRMVKYTLKRAAGIISVSESNKRELREYLGIENSFLLYNSIDENKFKPSGRKRKSLVITVGYIDETSWERKGINKFVELAKKSEEMGSDLGFIVAGKIAGEMQDDIDEIQKEHKSILFLGFLSNEELLKLYQMAKVYCQLSYHEAFGISVAEAMLCECVPVVSNRAALPEVVGNTGIITDLEDINQIYFAVKEATEKSGKHARKRIVELFTIEKREKELPKVVSKCYVQCCST